MNCRHVCRLLPLHVGGDLGAALAGRVEAHLASCVTCRTEYAAYETSRQSLFALKGSRGAAAPDLWPALRERLRALPPPARPVPWRALAAGVVLAACGAAALEFAAGPRAETTVPAAVVAPAGPEAGSSGFLLSEVGPAAPAGRSFDLFPSVRIADTLRRTWDEF